MFSSVFIYVFFFLPGNTNDVNAFLSETVQRKKMLARSLVLTQLTLAMFSEETNSIPEEREAMVQPRNSKFAQAEPKKS